MKFRVSIISGLVLLGIGNATSAIVAFDAADAKFRPEVVSGNGSTSIVNIQAADSNGVSRNIYSEFNINRNESVILNNANKETAVMTNGANGKVSANASLANGTAKIILNEVNSNQASQISGSLEVAGDRADVIIANPSGINVGGGTFYNANQVTLAAGSAVFDNTGKHVGYNVSNSDTNISGFLYAEDSKLNILSGSVNMIENSFILADTVKMVLGNNEISSDLNTVTKIAGATTNANGLTMTDASFIYSDNISIKSTNSGVGVNLNNTSRFMSNTKNSAVTIDADGIVRVGSLASIYSAGTLNIKGSHLDNSGSLTGNMTVSTTGSILNNGVLNGRVVGLNTAGTLTNNGRISANSDLNITAGDVLNNEQIYTENGGNALNITATSNSATGAKGEITNNGQIGKTYQYNRYYNGPVKSITLSANNINNNGSINPARDLNITATNTLTNNGLIFSDGRLIIKAGDVTNSRNAKIQGSAETVITATKNGDINTKGVINNLGLIKNSRNYNSLLEINGFSVNNDGDMSVSGGKIDITSTTNMTNNGSINSNGTLKISAGDVLNSKTGNLRGKDGTYLTASRNLLGGTGSVVNQGVIKVDGSSYFKPCYFCNGTYRYAELIITGHTVSNEGRIITNNLRVNAPTGSYSNTGTISQNPRKPAPGWGWGWGGGRGWDQQQRW